MFMFDAHLDLALNAIDWNRDLRQDVDDIRAKNDPWEWRMKREGARIL